MNYLKMNLLNHQLINYLNQVRDMAMLLVDMMVVLLYMVEKYKMVLYLMNYGITMLIHVPGH